MNKTKIITLPISKLVKAEWNYKTDGTPEQIAKLAESIKHDQSAGIPAVREIEKGKYEIIDGNHRLDAIKLLGWKEIICENFGKISLAVAILISKRRNTVWFEDDVLKYAELFRDEVLKDFTIDQIENFMPDTKEELESLSKLLDFDWRQSDFDNQNDDGLKTVKVIVSDKTYAIWQDWVARVRKIYGKKQTEGRAFEIAIVEALNIPEESLK